MTKPTTVRKVRASGKKTQWKEPSFIFRRFLHTLTKRPLRRVEPWFDIAAGVILEKSEENLRLNNREGLRGLRWTKKSRQQITSLIMGTLFHFFHFHYLILLFLAVCPARRCCSLRVLWLDALDDCEMARINLRVEGWVEMKIVRKL